MTDQNEPPSEGRIERGTAMDIALVVAPLVQPTIEGAKLLHDAIKDQTPKEQPPQIVLPPGVDLDE
jgi:hypothetical protein